MKPLTEAIVAFLVVALITAALIGMYILRAESAGLLPNVTIEETR